jgi:hypothetical protein
MKGFRKNTSLPCRSTETRRKALLRSIKVFLQPNNIQCRRRFLLRHYSTEAIETGPIMETTLSRQAILAALTDGLRDHPAVYALWLEGADAHGRSDQYSDLDLWLDVEDGQIDAVLTVMRALFTALAPLDYDHEFRHPHPQIRQVCFHLQGTPEFLYLDICLQDHSRPPSFQKGTDAEKVLVFFDRTGVTVPQEIDWTAFQEELSQRTEELRAIFPLLCTRTRRPIARGDYLEAYGYYGQVLNALVELMRIRYQPTKHDFGLKHTAHDLPPEVVAELACLYSVGSVDDIAARLRRAEVVFQEVSAEG